MRPSITALVLVSVAFSVGACVSPIARYDRADAGVDQEFQDGLDCGGTQRGDTKEIVAPLFGLDEFDRCMTAKGHTITPI